MKQNALALFVCVLVGGCIDDGSLDEETVETSESPIIIRPIPPPATVYRVGYYVLDDSPTGCAAHATEANIREGLRVASEAWAASNVRFDLEFIRRIPAPHLQDLGSSVLWSYSEVSAELAPLLRIGSFDWVVASRTASTSEEWLRWAASHRPPQPAVVVYVPCYEAPERYYGNPLYTGAVHVPADYVSSSLVGYWLGMALHL